MISLYFVFSIDYQLISHRKPIVKAAIEKGYKVTVVAQDTGYRKEIEKMGAFFIDLPINRVGTNVIQEIRTFLFLWKLFYKNKPDIVHLVSVKIVLWGGLAAKLSKINSVVNAINGLGIFFENGKVDSLVKKIFLCIVSFSTNRENVITIFQNNEDKQFFKTNVGLKEKNIRIIKGSGVNLEEFRYVKVPTSYPLKIVFTSRMIEEKGVLDIIKAAQILYPQYKDKIIFLLYGLLETNPKAVSKELLDEKCDGKYIIYSGFVENVRQVLEDSTIVVLPSYYREGIPKSLIEATAIGRPIITTDWIGCKETVLDAINGFLVPVKSPEILADKIRLLVDDFNLIEKMGKASRKIAEENFSIQFVIEKHLAIYKELIDK